MANRVAEATLPRGERTRGRFFNTSAFTRPDLCQIGNAGRNILIGYDHRQGVWNY